MDKKYLSIPIRGKYRITEGWYYSEQEKRIHGLSEHGGVDFACPRGTEVLAAAAGWAISSYSQNPFFDRATRRRRLYKNKKVEMGLGNFVQIFHPETKRYTQYGHLEKISSQIPFATPREMQDGRLIPIGHKMDPKSYPNYAKAVWVERGETIGYVGDSGLGWGYEDYPTRPDPKKFPSWDETHLHFEEFIRNSRGLKKRRDPFGIYGRCEEYPWPGHARILGKESIWLRLT